MARTSGASCGMVSAVSFLTSSLLTMPFSVFRRMREDVDDCVGALACKSAVPSVVTAGLSSWGSTFYSE